MDYHLCAPNLMLTQIDSDKAIANLGGAKVMQDALDYDCFFTKIRCRPGFTVTMSGSSGNRQ